MYSAFNTLQTKLEELIQHREALAISIGASINPVLDNVNLKIEQHEAAIKVLIAYNHEHNELNELVQSVKDVPLFNLQSE